MHILPIIPARFESERFRGKLLETYKHQPVIEWAIDACHEAFGFCFVLSDDIRITEAVSSNTIWLQGNYRNGTERIADACNRMNIADDTLIMHVQGDEVGLNHEDLARLAMAYRGSCVSTLFYRCEDDKMLKSRDHVKCWPKNKEDGWAFSRHPDPLHEAIHVGVYAYRRSMLHRYMERWPTEDEKRERLEQLRWNVPIVAYEVSPCKSINVPEDLL